MMISTHILQHNFVPRTTIQQHQQQQQPKSSEFRMRLLVSSSSTSILCVIMLVVLLQQQQFLMLLPSSLAFTITTTTTTPIIPIMKAHNSIALISQQQQTQPPQRMKYRINHYPLYAWRLIGKYFQIEEMEDRDSCTTEVILNPNSTITTLETNGPLHKNAYGYWKLDTLTGDFIMILYRTYEAGRDSKISTDVGVFTFTTIRKYIGRLYNIGIKQGISGNIYDVTDNNKYSDINNDHNHEPTMILDDITPVTELRKVGFFEMIDTTLNEDGEITLRGRTRSM